MNKEELSSLLYYQEGKLFWKQARGNVTNGKRAGCPDANGYRRVRIDGKIFGEHRLIYLLHHGYIPNYIDHINGNPSDNRIENLRDYTLTQNQQNRKLQKTNSSGVTGVSWNKQINKWFAEIRHKRTRVYQGYFDKLEDASYAVSKARKEFLIYLEKSR